MHLNAPTSLQIGKIVAENGYGQTIRLPKTSFAMRAKLPQLEEKLLARWRKIDLWQQIRQSSESREKFVLHDGPPYANGGLHMGHVLNKVLKDIINKSRQMMGYNAHYVPGWDCHGLPIEWLVEENFRKSGLEPSSIAAIDFRKACRDSATHWMGVQSDGFQRLGVFGDWENPYLTMSFQAEALTAEELGKFLLSGALYRGVRPVQWSVVEQTTLADAETEYHEHTSSTAFVGYRLISGAYEGDDIVIWTTTPWTIPSSQAIAYHESMPYDRLEVQAVGDESPLCVGQKFWIASSLRESLAGIFKVEKFSVLATISGQAIADWKCVHPLSSVDEGYKREIPLLAADFVTDDQGTGFVHTSPDHGLDDFYLGKENGLEPLEMIGLDGKFKPHVPLFAGACVWDEKGKNGNANGLVQEALQSADRLYARGRLRHQYPHSWRSKAPLMTLVTPQWFISMSQNDLRKKALTAIEETKFYPREGQKRLHAMIKDRPDWCVSRQRIWGVPLPIFVHKETGEPLKDIAVLERTIAYFKEEGADAWFSRDKKDFLGSSYSEDDYEQVKDVVDVWFDSGSTHRFVLDERQELSFPADMYLEGTDQHRGWFHSSLLESCGTKGVAPYKSILTHGFVLDGKGKKMSKSVGNILDPKAVIEKLGAEILRLWVVESRYYDDMKADMQLMQKVVDIYRKFRNTLRWLLGNLAHETQEPQDLQASSFSALDRYMLHRLSTVNQQVWDLSTEHEYLRLYRLLHEFCVQDLSSLYFDVCKDTLYCDGKDSPSRLAVLYVLREVFDHLVRWLAPVLSFTAEEAYLARKGIDNESIATSEDELSIHTETFPEVHKDWIDNDLAEQFSRLIRARKVVLGALEIARAEGIIGSGLQSCVHLYVEDELSACIESSTFSALCIVSEVQIHPLDAASADAFRLDEEPLIAVRVAKANGTKCERCWAVRPEVGRLAINDVCNRCFAVLENESLVNGG